MPDPLYLSVWFPEFGADSVIPRLLSVMRQFPFSATRPGVEYVSVHPVSWSEPTILERRFRPGIPPEEAVQTITEFLNDDYAYAFECFWDLWTPASEAPEAQASMRKLLTVDQNSEWILAPHPVSFIAHGLEFDQGAFQQNGHIQVDFGLDTPFLQEQVRLTPEAEARVRVNVQQLVTFTVVVEKNCGISGRLLWSESEENLAQKLIARLQTVQ